MAIIKDDSVLFEQFLNYSKFQELPEDIHEILAYATENYDGVILAKDGMEIKNAIIANLSNHHLERLSMPEAFPYRLKIESTGNPATRSFEVKYKVVDKYGRELPITGYKGISINVGSNEYIVTDPYFSFFNVINKINSNIATTIGERLDLVKLLKDQMPEDVIVSNENIMDFTIIKADRFTLDVSNPEAFDVLPELIDSANDSTLPPSLSKEFKNEFISRRRPQSFLKIGNSFIKPSNTLLQALEVVKKVREESIEKRRAFFINPRERLLKELGDALNEEVIDSLFMENEAYVSQRVSHLGVWTPKAGVFLPPADARWIPKDKVCMRLDDSYCFVNPDKADDLFEQMACAEANGIDQIIYDNERIPINDISLNQISDFIGTRSRNQSCENTIESPENPYGKEKIEKWVAIIKDNIEENEFEKQKFNIYNQIKKYIPNGLKVKSLFHHQLTGVEWLQDSFINRKPGVLLADDMGLGKTLQSLVFLKWVKEQSNLGKIPKKPFLIVGPAGLLKNWKEEHNSRLEPPGLGRRVDAYGPEFKKLREESIFYIKKKFEGADWVLTTYETLRDQEKYFRNISWQIILFDEIQKIKSPTSMMTDMAKAMESDFSIGLTGTPVENRLQDLWCVADCLHPGFLHSLRDFSKEYEKPKNPDLLGLSNKILADNPPPFMLRRLKDDVLDGLPAKNENKIEEIMSPRQAELYNSVLQEAQVEINTRGAALKALQRIRKISLFLEENIEQVDDQYVSECARLKSTVELLDQIREKKEKVLIFLENRRLQQLLSSYFVKRYSINPVIINGSIAGDKRQALKHEFELRFKGFDIMLISPKAGGVGLNITAANNVIHLERWWNPAIEDQCTCRVYRIGQQREVNVFYPIAIHPTLNSESFDSILDELLERKRKLSKNVICVSDLSDQDMAEMFARATRMDMPLEDDKFDDVLNSDEWMQLKKRFFQNYKKECQRCGAVRDVQVDHVKPRAIFPDLALEYSNLQALCGDCNRLKGINYGSEWDFRR